MSGEENIWTIDIFYCNLLQSTCLIFSLIVNYISLPIESGHSSLEERYNFHVRGIFIANLEQFVLAM